MNNIKVKLNSDDELEIAEGVPRVGLYKTNYGDLVKLNDISPGYIDFYDMHDNFRDDLDYFDDMTLTAVKIVEE